VWLNSKIRLEGKYSRWFNLELKIGDYAENFCKADKSIAFIPHKKIEVPLAKLKEKLIEAKASITAETPFVLIFKFHGANVSIFKSGRILVKEVEEKEAKRILKRLLELLKSC